MGNMIDQTNDWKSRKNLLAFAKIILILKFVEKVQVYILDLLTYKMNTYIVLGKAKLTNLIMDKLTQAKLWGYNPRIKVETAKQSKKKGKNKSKLEEEIDSGYISNLVQVDLNAVFLTFGSIVRFISNFGIIVVSCYVA
jgi:hypothetical protein